jgi:hypothetical protein
VLEEGLARQAEAGRPLLAALADATAGQNLSRYDRFLALGRAGLQRLEQERDVNRLLLRDLASFPDLLEQVRAGELARVHEALSGFVHREVPAAEDPAALAAVVMAAVSHYWIMNDVFAGVHPHGVDADRFLRTLAEIVAGRPNG